MAYAPGGAPIGAPTAPPAERFLVVHAEGFRLALPLACMREVLPAPRYTRLPGTGAEVCGLINLRGQIVTVVDLGARLGLTPAATLPEHGVVIVQYGRTQLGLAVAAVAGLGSATADELEETGAALQELELVHDFVRGAVADEAGVLIALDADALLRPLFAEVGVGGFRHGADSV